MTANNKSKIGRPQIHEDPKARVKAFRDRQKSAGKRMDVFIPKAVVAALQRLMDTWKLSRNDAIARSIQNAVNQLDKPEPEPAKTYTPNRLSIPAKKRKTGATSVNVDPDALSKDGQRLFKLMQAQGLVAGKGILFLSSTLQIGRHKTPDWIGDADEFNLIAKQFFDRCKREKLTPILPTFGIKDIARLIGHTETILKDLCPNIDGAYKNSAGWQIPYSAIPTMPKGPKYGK